MTDTNKKQKGYFVFFGPANVGKSTIIGYILTQKDWTQDKLLQQENKFKEKIGNDYQQNRFYSYFVDEAQDEYKKNAEKKRRKKEKKKRKKNGEEKVKTFGTSKYTHIKDMNDEFVLIDTPGGNDYEIQRYKGLSLANMGIFAIEIKQLLDMQNTIPEENMQRIKLIREFFSSWYVWQKLHGADNTIILLTKYDLSEGKENYETAKNVLCEIIGDAINSTTIIPTSIGLKLDERKDTNIFTKLDENWYNGKTLMQTIEEKNGEICTTNATYNLLMFYNQDFGNVQRVGYTIKWKVASGIISTKDKIKIAPVLLKDGNYTSVLATIKSMQNENKKALEYGETGNIVSTALSSIIDDNSTIPKKEISICKTAIITDKDRQIKIGNKITVSIKMDNCSDKELNVISKININEQIHFLWYGRILYPSINDIDRTQNNKIILVLKLDDNTNRESRQIALPEDMLPKKTILQIIKYQSDLPRNYNCEVTNIEEDR
ncbi:hypothetical protein AGMMS49965_10640 [Bacteroidia bacterium]|nr:hypothetical protein AGMMS49965_10640 [Bacteroidia bacterium]